MYIETDVARYENRNITSKPNNVAQKEKKVSPCRVMSFAKTIFYSVNSKTQQVDLKNERRERERERERDQE